eukprot:13364249-Alexandrium_andersonii.AAC.1
MVTRTPLGEEGNALGDKAATFQPPPAPELSLPDGPSGQTAAVLLSLGRARLTIWPEAMNDDWPSPGY